MVLQHLYSYCLLAVLQSTPLGIKFAHVFTICVDFQFIQKLQNLEKNRPRPRLLVTVSPA